MLMQKRNRKWLLIVDDDADLRSSMREMVETSFGDSVSVIEANDGVEATVKINHQAFDCILTDLEMPRKEGDSLIRQIRSNSFNSLTPVIIVSGSDSKDRIQDSHDFVYLVAKPFQSDELMELIRKQLHIGSNDNRVSAEVLNNLIKAMSDFVAEVSNDPIEQMGDLEFKPAGTALKEQFSSSIKVKIGEVINTFSILVEEEELRKLSEYSENLKDKSPEDVLNAMSYVVLKHVMDQSGLIKRDQFKANFIFHDKQVLKDKTGVLLTLGNKNVQFKVFATTR